MTRALWVLEAMVLDIKNVGVSVSLCDLGIVLYLPRYFYYEW